jgi:folate-dependent phosphoribosylglycinamide formyltransferase PurN|tara:strand:- start:1121 stop:1903 length:783 start_codon:yes stop_codon:yes gene_type:complete
MRVTIFSSNQPRHLNLAKEFSKISDEVFFVSEVNTVFPGQVEDFFKKSEVMQSYFQNVISSERKIFGDIAFLPNNIRTLSIKSGDLNRLDKSQLTDAFTSDVYVVFGASFIKGWLVDFLVENRAINIHMGISPYYRGSSCNFWALYDNNPSYVGATIHLLSKGLDSGDMLFHCVPKLNSNDSPFDFTMRSVLVAQQGLVSAVDNKSIFSNPAVKQDKAQEIRYTKNQDFNDEIAKEFLDRNLQLKEESFSYPKLLNPVFG